ncbi:hypothetical protein ABID22_000090 [Pontibacter aydingkolensis]|uniref:DUF4270 domain-containing protein n=1 Tax=Pontibacter aydingkolensis TaxID=1911536 RepID=A0ABS7CQZ0_9BACT|nr:DUF4270 family protein [Pontibacter aydingkolensis]MBW7466240.1 DUF4270 domain-containing protein [Pontibacter aydingkolensis]
MNSAVRRFLLFFFSIATLASCDDPTDIGIDLQDENQIGTDFTDTITINTGTVLLTDSILSFKTTPAQAGILSDPVLGTLKATTYTEVALNGSDLSFGENPQVDSLVLTLDYSFIYGNKTQPLKLNVFRLTEGFQEKASYFTSTTLAKEATPLGSATLVPLLYEKKKQFDVDSTAAKRLVKIKLPQSLIDEFVAQSGQSPLKSQDNFEAFFKGLAIAPEGAPSSILALNLAADSSKIVMHYRNGTNKKKHIFRFAQSPAVSYFTNFEGNRAGTVVESLNQAGDFLPATEENGKESYIQNNTQLVTKLTLPYLQKFKEATGSIIINRAELILPIKANSTSVLPAPPQLVAYQTNSTNRILKDVNGSAIAVQQNGVGQLNGTNFPAALFYDAKRSRYTLNITSYFQAMLLDKKPNTGLLLATATVVPSQGGNSITPEIRPYRTIITNTDNNKVQLVVYYSKLK